MASLPLSLRKLTAKQRIYVESRLAGLTQVASAAAAGYVDPASDCTRIERSEEVQRAMVAAMNDIAEEIGFTRKDAHEMLMSAYMNAATAAEQIAAVKEMIALHGLAVPKKLEVEHKHSGNITLESMETEELIKLADMEHLTLEGEYEVVKDDDERNDTKALPDL